MKQNLVKYGHGIGRLYAHIRFKTKYTHKVFEKEPEFRAACEKIFYKIAEDNKIDIGIPGFDDNHMHMVVDIGLKSIPQMKKLFKGTSGRKLFQQFPEVKKKYFWGSGLWSPVTYGANPTEINFTVNYIRTQKYGSAREQAKQYRLSLFCD